MKTSMILGACFFLGGSLLAQPIALTSPEEAHVSETSFHLIKAIVEKKAALKAFRALYPLVPFSLPVTVNLHSVRPGGRRPATVSGSTGSFTLVGSLDLPFSPVDPVIAPYSGNYPAPPPNPRLIFLDGLGNTLVAVDLNALSIVSQVVVPSTSGPFGIRPAASGPANEVWVANAGLQVTVADLGKQSVVTNIPTSSLSPSALPVGIVFTPDGSTAFEAFQFPSPDSSGNGGALLVFDAVNRKLVSTFLLKNGPTAALIAPDGSSLYLLGGSGLLTYYDVLSGTADLTVSTYPPGQGSGYPGASSSVFIHPDGTRLFWNVGVFLTAFDLNTRQATQFTSGLPTTAAPAFTLSQDGARAYFSNALGDVAIMDTRTGTILATTNTGASTTVLGGPPVAP